MNLKPLWSLAEKTIATYVQAFIVALTASTFFEQVNLSLARTLAIAAIPAALTVLINATSAAQIPLSLPVYLQAVLRTIRTGAVGFLGYLLAIPTFHLDTSVGQAALSAAGVAVLAAIKAELGQFVGNKGSVAWLPASKDPVPSTPMDAPLPPLHT